MKTALLHFLLVRPGKRSLRWLVRLFEPQLLVQVWRLHMQEAWARWHDPVVHELARLPFLWRQELVQFAAEQEHLDLLEALTEDTVPRIRLDAMQALIHLNHRTEEMAQRKQALMQRLEAQDQQLAEKHQKFLEESANYTAPKPTQTPAPTTGAEQEAEPEMPEVVEQKSRVLPIVFGIVVLAMGLGILYVSHFSHPGSFMFPWGQVSFGWVFLAYGIYRLWRR